MPIDETTLKRITRALLLSVSLGTFGVGHVHGATETQLPADQDEVGNGAQQSQDENDPELVEAAAFKDALVSGRIRQIEAVLRRYPESRRVSGFLTALPIDTLRRISHEVVAALPMATIRQIPTHVLANLNVSPVSKGPRQIGPETTEFSDPLADESPLSLDVRSQKVRFLDALLSGDARVVEQTILDFPESDDLPAFLSALPAGVLNDIRPSVNGILSSRMRRRIPSNTLAQMRFPAPSQQTEAIATQPGTTSEKKIRFLEAVLSGDVRLVEDVLRDYPDCPDIPSLLSALKPVTLNSISQSVLAAIPQSTMQQLTPTVLANLRAPTFVREPNTNNFVPAQPDLNVVQATY